MDDLIARLEKATGPDRELDGDIVLHLGLVPHGMERGWPGGWAGDGKQFDAEWYTKSIDAALTLVPEDWCLFEMGQLGRNNQGWYVNLMHRHEVGEVSSSHESFAVALCIAALKARADTQARDR